MKREEDVPKPIAQALAAAADQLRDAGVPDPMVDAELILAHVLGESRGRVQALALTGSDISDESVFTVESMARRRAQREPLQHITGLAPFRQLELRVGPGVFVPRPETEWVTQLAIDALNHERTSTDDTLIAVDLCTGSGAIALSIATEVSGVSVWAVEKSADAFAWTAKNRDRVGTPNLTIELAEVAGALPQLSGRVDVVVSNPPYIPEDAIPRDPEVRNFDPAMALYGGADGLDVVREVSVNAKRLLKPEGRIIIEHGELQGAEIREILVRDGYALTETRQDFTGRDRATTALRSRSL